MYTREQYEQDRRNAIEDGIDPRLIMSYSECLAWDAYQAEKERDESEEWRLSEFDAYGVEERDELLELVEMAEESAMTELGAFGSSEPWFYGEPDMSWYGADNSKTVWSDERYLVGEEWDAWDAATDDIPERFFELDWSM